MALDPTKRRAALKLLKAGKCTIAEVCRLAEVSHQVAWYWARAAEIDPWFERAKLLRQQWNTALRRPWRLRVRRRKR